MLRAITLAFVFVLTTCAPAAAALPSAHAAPGTLTGSVVSELNRARALHGLRPLRPTRALSLSARRHSVQMARGGFFDHDSSDGTPFWRRIGRFYADHGFSTWAVGENIFWHSPGTLAAPSVVRSWLGSPGHRENVLSRQWRDVGVGVVSLASAPGVYRGSPVTIVTVDFGQRQR